jgi:small neutral amino acid transporter SnatA (MarC family)
MALYVSSLLSKGVRLQALDIVLKLLKVLLYNIGVQVVLEWIELMHEGKSCGLYISVVNISY